MMTYIKRENALNAFNNAFYSGLAAKIKEIPSEDVAPVQHGRWIWLGPICDKFGEVEGRAFKCSACNYVLGIYHNSEFYRYCPNCGARMNEGDIDEIDRR